jgi:signal transduction histidine kinase
MGLNRKPLFLIILFLLVLMILIFSISPVDLNIKAPVIILFFISIVFFIIIELVNYNTLKRLINGLHDLLITSLNEILKEVTEGKDLDNDQEFLPENIPEKIEDESLFSRLAYSQQLFNRQISILRKKNLQIKDLNDKIFFSKKQLEAVFDALGDGLCIVNRDFRIFRLNRAYADYCSDSLKNLLNQKSHDVFPGIKRIKADDVAERTFKTGEVISDVKVESNTPEGKLYFLFGTYPIFRGDQVEYVLEHFRNITNEKKINDQLIRSSNLATIGTMITGIAHEMNNPLSGISGCAVNMINMADNYGLNKKGMERVKDILESANRAETIFKDLLDLSRKRESQFIIMNIIPVIEKSIRSIHIKGYDKIKKEVRLAPDIRPIINCDPTRITQIFINLLSNATLSLLDMHKTKAGTDPVAAGPPVIEINLKKDINFYVIEVTDNGVGISPDKLQQIFDPFYTTRPPGQGTGLGLSICSKIMLEHKGRIYVESGDGKTTFTLEFPIHKADV